MKHEEYNQLYEQIMDAIRGGAFIPADLEEKEVVYHYTSLDGFKGILDSGKLQITGRATGTGKVAFLLSPVDQGDTCEW